MKKYNCIIVEDEPLAAEVLEDYVKQVPFLEWKGTCSDAMYAMDKLQHETIDLLFLDIHLPKLKGTDFLKTLKPAPHAIITSAYAEYALEGYELNVLDYLLKPVEFSRFLMAVNKLQQLAEHAAPVLPQAAANQRHLFFNVARKNVKIMIGDILFIESVKEYIRVVTADKTILTKFDLHEIETVLPAGQFIRVHRSFIVAKNKIDAFTPTDVEVKGLQIPIGRTYKEFVLASLNNW